MRPRKYAYFGTTVLLMCWMPLLCAAAAPETIALEGERIAVKVDVKNCRWSAELKGTDVKLNKVHFLGDDNPAGWTVTATVNRNDVNPLGAFETVTLHGVYAGRLDFDYHISASKRGNDIVVRLDRANHTDAAVEIRDMDGLVVDDARLGGTNDKWQSFGVRSSYSEYYDLTPVKNFPMEDWVEYLRPQKMYQVCHLVRNTDTGSDILMGHLTVNKGHSRFEVGRKDASDSMWMRAYCAYYVTMPPGKSFTGEKLLVRFGADGLRDLEHLGDLIGVANNIRLREKRPLNPKTGWNGWASGGRASDAVRFVKEHGLDKFGFSVGQGDFGAHASWALDHAGGSSSRRGGASAFPAECYLSVNIPRGNGKVLDFSNPVSVETEKQRIARAFAGNEDKANSGVVDYSEIWDKWPGQHDPSLSAVETWHAAAAPWRDFVDTKSPRTRSLSCMTKLDFNYGYIDRARIAEDDDGMAVPDAYAGGPDIRGFGHRGFLGETVPGAAMRFFYNGRVFWNDGNHSHVYKYEGGRIQPYDQAKVTLNFKALATSYMALSDAFDVPYPEDRIELIKRVSPPTDDVAYPADLFVRKPAVAWNLPVERPFGKWNILGIFNYSRRSSDFKITLDARDLRLDPNTEYLVYEFWSKELVGTFRGKFVSRAIPAKDCDIYSLVPKQDRPVLVSTSRHVRQMAFDIKDLRWDGGQNRLHGLSRAVSGDPYQLRIWVPAGYRLERVELPAGLTATTKTQGDLLLVDYTTSTDSDVAWTVHFSRPPTERRTN